MPNGSPVHFGKGSCKVSVYLPTQSLPYYRLCYRVGGRRYQRTRKTFEEAEESAKAILEPVKGGKGVCSPDHSTGGMRSWCCPF